MKKMKKEEDKGDVEDKDKEEGDEEIKVMMQNDERIIKINKMKDGSINEIKRKR